MGRGYIHPVAFAVMQSQRRAQASFAERLYVTEGVSAEELRDMRTGQMAALCKRFDGEPAASARRVKMELCEGSLAGAIPGSDIVFAGEVIGKVADRTYTLEDMRTAYRLGFLAATDRTEEARAYFSTNEYSDDREASLGRL